MKVSSKTGFRGVERHRSKYRAFHQKRLMRQTIGLYDSAENAARAFDEYIVAQKGIGLAFHQLNFPTRNHREAFDVYQSELEEKRRAQEQAQIDRLRSIQIRADQRVELLEKFRSGVSVSELASQFGTHPDNVVSTLRELEQERFALIGLVSRPEPQITEDSLREHVTQSQRTGESVRSIAQRLGIDRKMITRWLGQE